MIVLAGKIRKKITGWLLLGLLAFFAFLMLRITLPYLAMEDNVAFLRIKKSVIGNQGWKASFYVHVFTSMFALVAGFTQFSSFILKKHKRLHRGMGLTYVAVVLLLSGPAGFWMGLYANGGLSSRIAFCLLAALWWGSTFLAFRAARKSDFVRHKNFMIYSYALTLSAITLRAWKWLIVLLFQPNPMDVYMLVAWLGWVPNVVVALLIVAQGRFTKLLKFSKPERLNR